MKKILFLAVLSVAVLTMQAQNAKKLPVAAKLSKDLKVFKPTLDKESLNIYPNKPYNNYTHEKGIQTVNKVAIGSSKNVYSILLPEQTCLTANSDLGVIMFTHRKNVPIVTGENSGFIQAHYSTDGGLNWDSLMLHSDVAKLGRYPSGVIYNPTGNTSVNNAYAIAAGPYTPGSGWMGSFHASKRFDGQNGNEYFLDVDTLTASGSFLPRSWMQSDNTGRVRVMGEKNFDNGTNYTSYKTTILTGVFNTGTNAWDWTSFDKVPDYLVGTGGLPDGLRTPAMTFSEDGQTGYLVYSGRNALAVDTSGYHPMIYKTIDGGTTWNLQTAVDWNAIPAISDNLVPTSTPSISRAFFGLIQDAIVDANGYLHFSCFINSASSNNYDSLGYSWQYTKIQGYMYHCYQTASGWNADTLGIQWGKDVDAANSPINPATWNSRLQMSKTPAQDKIIFAWIDTDTSFSTYNLYPDIKTKMFDINTGTYTPTLNLTTGTTYDANNYFMYLSNYSFYNSGTNTVTLHITTSEYGTTDVDPAYHYYLTGAQVAAGINEPAQGGSLSSVSQNYPNPFSGTTSVDITLNCSSKVDIEITNMLGQKVNSISKQLTTGTHTVTLNADNLKTGIYFYTVRTNNSTITHKMIVK